MTRHRIWACCDSAIRGGGNRRNTVLSGFLLAVGLLILLAPKILASAVMTQAPDNPLFLAEPERLNNLAGINFEGAGGVQSLDPTAVYDPVPDADAVGTHRLDGGSLPGATLEANISALDSFEPSYGVVNTNFGAQATAYTPTIESDVASTTLSVVSASYAASATTASAGKDPSAEAQDGAVGDGDRAVVATGDESASQRAYAVTPIPLVDDDHDNGRVNPVINRDDPPSFDQSSYSRSIFENAPAGTAVGEPITASFDGDLNYMLAGQDSGSFEITTSGQLQAKSDIGDYEDSESQKSYALTVNVSAVSDGSLQAQAQVSVTVVNLVEDGDSVTIGDVTWTRIPETRFLIAYEGTGSNETRRPDLEIHYQPQCMVESSQRLHTDMWVDGQRLKIRWRLDGEETWRPTDSDDPGHPDWESYDLLVSTDALRQGTDSSCNQTYNEIWNDAEHIFAADIRRHLITAYRLTNEGTVLTRARELDIPLIDDHYFSHFRVYGMWGDSETIWATQGRDIGGIPRSVAYDKSTFRNLSEKDMAFDGTENVLDAHIVGDTVWVQNFNNPTKVTPYERTATSGEFYDGTPLHAKKDGVGTLDAAGTDITNPERITGQGSLVYVMHRENNRMTTFDLSGSDGPEQVESEFDFQDIPDYDGTACLQAHVPYCPTGISTANPSVMYFSFADGQIRYIQKITPNIGEAITLSLKENSPPNQDIGPLIQAAEQTGSYTWTVSGDDSQFFDTLTSGQGNRYIRIRTKDEVDYDHEAKDEYSFNLTVADSDNDQETSVVTVKITDVDEPPPPPTNVQADGGPGRILVTWQQPTVPPGTPAISSYQVEYTRCDSDGQSCLSPLTHEALPGDSTVLEDLEENQSYRLMIRSVNDEGNSDWVALSDHATTTSKPVITGGPTFLVDENSTPVGTISVTDADSNEQIDAQVTGSDAGLFNIVEMDNGEQGLTITVSFLVAPDYEDQAIVDSSHTYQITVAAVSGTGTKEGTSEAVLTVTVQNINEDPTGKPTIAGVPEEDETLTVDWSGLSDPDGPITDPTYDWLGASDDKVGTDPTFTIKKAQVNDDIKVRVNYQAGPFAGQAESDPVGPIRGNSPPMFQGENTREVPENMSGIAVTFVATDENATDVIVYRLADNTIASDNDLFDIVGSSGEVGFKIPPNFETPGDTYQGDLGQSGDNSYQVAIQASSGSGAKLRETTGHFTIVVLDVEEPPGKPEPPDVTGTTVSSISISWQEPDNTGPGITGYAVQSRQEDETAYTEADHSGTTRTATIAGLEENTTYLVRVQASNEEGTSDWSETSSGKTKDHPPPVFTTTDTTTNLTMAENTPEGTNIGDPISADAHEGAVLTYSLIGGDADQFQVVESTGQLQAAAVDYDFESDKTAYSLTVKVADEDGRSAEHPVVITLLDVEEPPGKPEPPDVTGTTVSSISITWQEPGNTGPDITGYGVQYRQEGETEYTGADHSGTTPTATITGLEANTTYMVRVQATNDEGTSDWSDDRQAVTNINQPPQFPDDTAPELKFDENTPADRVIGTITAVDPEGQAVDFYLTGPDRLAFNIASNSGTISTKTGQTYDYETKPSYQVTVVAQDTSSVSSSHNVAILLNNVNEPPHKPEPPEITGTTVSSISITWQEPGNTGPGITGYAVQYRRQDETDYTGAGHSGTTRTATIAGLEENTTYLVRVQATNDEGTGAWSEPSSGQTADHPPPAFQTPATTTNLTMAENTPAGTDIGDPVSATSHEGAVFTYSLTGEDSDQFQVVEDTGQIQSADVDYNFESDKTAYSLAVKATDQDGRSAEHPVVITLLDVEEPPGKPEPPDVTGTAVSGISITWQEPDNTGPGITGYTVQYRRQDETDYTGADHSGTTRTATITGLEENTTYLVRVQASNDEGTSDWSDDRQTETKRNLPPQLATPTATPVVTPPPTSTPAPTATPVVTPPPTSTPASTATPVVTPPPTSTPASTATPVVTPPPTSTPAPTATPVVTPPPTSTPAPTATPVVTPPPTSTPAPTATPVVTPPPTSTPAPTATPVVTPLPTSTPAPTATPVVTPPPISTPAPAVAITPAVTPSPSPSPTLTKRRSAGGGGPRPITPSPTVEPIELATPTPRPTPIPDSILPTPEAGYTVVVPTSTPTPTPEAGYTIVTPTNAPTPTPLALNPGAFLSNTPTPAMPVFGPRTQPTGVPTLAPTPTPEPVAEATPQGGKWRNIPNWLWWFILGLILFLVLLVFLLRRRNRRLQERR